MKIWMILTFLACLGACGKTSDEGPRVSTRPQSLKDQEYLRLMNEHRSRLGLVPLAYSTVIEDVALEHSENMSTGVVVFGHEGFSARCQRLGDEFGSRSCGEIVAAGQQSAARVLEAWLSSPPHRASIQNPRWTHTGLGMVKSADGRPYWTQMFLRLDD